MSTPAPVSYDHPVVVTRIVQQPKNGLVYTNPKHSAPANLRYTGTLRNLDKRAHVYVQFNELPRMGKPFRAFASVPTGTKINVNLSVPSRSVIGLETSPVVDLTYIDDAVVGFNTEDTKYLLCNINPQS